MSQTQAIEFALGKLLAELRQARLARLAASGRPRPDELKYEVERLKIQALAQRWQALLEPGLAALRSREHLLDMRREQLYRLPREHRYGERQSIDGTQGNLDRVRALADEGSRLLAQLHHELHGPPSVHDMLRGLHKIAGDLGKQLDQQEALAQCLQVADPQGAAKPAVTWANRADGAVLLVTVLVWLLQRLGRRG